MYYAVVDCDNCFVSCERVFRPDLNGKPVVVLSNNDGCVVSRSNEAKTLAKMASHYAKKYEGYQHCCMIDSDEKCERALCLYPVEEVWGIGRRYFARLKNMGIKTAYDFASHTRSWVRTTFNVVAERTWMELHGSY